MHGKVVCEAQNSDLYLYGPITSFSWGDEEVIAAKRVREELAKITTDEVTVHLNSPGGDAFEANAIHNLLKDSGKKITIVVDGMAASGATAILCAGSVRKAHKNALLLIHQAMTFVFGNVNDLKKAIADLEKVDQAQKQNYLGIWTGTEEELDEQMASDEFMTAEEALEKGLITEIIDDVNEEVPTPAEPQAQTSNKIVANILKTWKTKGN